MVEYTVVVEIQPDHIGNAGAVRIPQHIIDQAVAVEVDCHRVADARLR